MPTLGNGKQRQQGFLVTSVQRASIHCGWGTKRMRRIFWQTSTLVCRLVRCRFAELFFENGWQKLYKWPIRSTWSTPNMLLPLS